MDCRLMFDAAQLVNIGNINDIPFIETIITISTYSHRAFPNIMLNILIRDPHSIHFYIFLSHKLSSALLNQKTCNYEDIHANSAGFRRL